ncbi:MAG: threonine synthase [Gammaproteobacteria bacterium]
MKYLSTRGGGAPQNFEQVTLAGLAEDGGLFVPAAWPAFSEEEIRAFRGMPYAQLAARILGRFSGECIPAAGLAQLLGRAYCNFRAPEVAPLKQLGASLFSLELFHGPTFAFKDFALQFLGGLFGRFIGARGRTCAIIGATSGDTGSAAIEAVRGQAAISLHMLHPAGRVSEVQRRQMTTVTDANIHNLAVDGNFDDCQNLVKAMFNDAGFRRRHALAAVNSINWARIAAQTVYYFYAAVAVGAPEREVSFAVPSGNFGNVFAGYAARQMGLPVRRLIIGTNRNDILARFFASGRMARGKLRATLSPSMDIQISSNFERLLFELYARDGARIRDLMTRFAELGEFSVSREAKRKADEIFCARSFSDAETRAEMKRLHAASGEFTDPHSAIGVAAARAFAEDGVPTIALATAHPAKFGDAVRAACGADAPMPPALRDVLQLEERMTPVANDLEAVKALVAHGAAR